jgi:hypothetical protein
MSNTPEWVNLTFYVIIALAVIALVFALVPVMVYYGDLWITYWEPESEKAKPSAAQKANSSQAGSCEPLPDGYGCSEGCFRVFSGAGTWECVRLPESQSTF